MEETSSPTVLRDVDLVAVSIVEDPVNPGATLWFDAAEEDE